MKIKMGFFFIIVPLLLSACSSGSQQKTDYKNSYSLPALEIPPGLSQPEINAGMNLPEDSATRTGKGKISQILVPFKDIHLQRDGQTRWLVVDASAEKVWPRMREFWLQAGFILRIDDQNVGIIETDWAENRADIPMGPVRKVIGKAFDALYSASTRDKYRVRIERIQNQQTELYLTHRGLEEVVDGESTVWQKRASDPELEIEMYRRLMQYWGLKERQIKASLANKQAVKEDRAILLTTQDKKSLQILRNYDTAWRLVGIALEKKGFLVEERDKSSGIYQVNRIDDVIAHHKKGFFSKFSFSKKKKKALYWIKLIEYGKKTQVTILDKEQQLLQTHDALEILELLHEQIN